MKQEKERIQRMIKIGCNHLDAYFEKGDLIPAIVYEVNTKTVLMLAYMNRESLKKTLETGYTWFWSRSRQELWNKVQLPDICKKSSVCTVIATMILCWSM